MTLELASTPTATLIEGGVGCGKTTALVARVAALLEDGATPEDMLVLARHAGCGPRPRRAPDRGRRRTRGRD